MASNPLNLTVEQREWLTRMEAEIKGELPGVVIDDFYAYLPMHAYIYTPTRDVWPGSSVNSRIVFKDESGKWKTPSAFLDMNRSVEQMTWAPGEPMLIKNRLVSEGGWFSHTGVTCFNLYRPPETRPGNPDKAAPWLEHIDIIYEPHRDHIVKWLAHRVQRPQEKINHALVLGGAQGIGKDTILEPVKTAVGPWNFYEISPTHLLGRFNGWLKSVILRISEARDLGDIDRFAFYDHLKAYTAAPPDVLRCDEKNIREYSVFNICGVVITSNHKTDGIYLPADDRRHYVAWSDKIKDDFQPEYWNRLYKWYDAEGRNHVSAYLRTLDISDFNPKQPPPKTDAFWAIVDASCAPEDGELADAIDKLGNPDALMLDQVRPYAEIDFSLWLKDRKNARIVPHRMEAAGYEPVRNPDTKDGRWKVDDKKQVIYAKRSLCVREKIEAARKLLPRGW
jgi:hypothetical protein